MVINTLFYSLVTHGDENFLRFLYVIERNFFATFLP